MKWRNLKRWICLLLAATLVLGTASGCSSKDREQNGTGNGSSQDGSTQDSGGQAKGRFQEEDIDTGAGFGNIFDMKKLEDGTVRLIDYDYSGMGAVWDSGDQGKTWEKAYDFPAEVQGQYDRGMSSAALSPDGQAVCVVEENTDNGSDSILYLLDKDGKADRIPFALSEAKGTDKIISDVQFPDSSQAVIQDDAGMVYQVDVSNGNVKHTYEFGTGGSDCRVFAVGNTLMVQKSSEVLLYDMETGEQKSSEEALNKGGAENGFFSAVDTLDAGESIYCLSPGGLYHYKFGGSVMEQLIDGSMNSLGAPWCYPAALAMVDEENLFVAANDPNSNSIAATEIWKYTYSADIPAKPDKELKIYSLYDNEEMRQFIHRFQKDHLDMYVNYQIALADENGMTVSDALKTLTTEIMAGSGPDVLLLDYMPVEAYIEKGVLRDLAPLLEEEGSYFEKIISAYQDDEGQICAAPARFLIPLMYADSSSYTPGEDFNTFTERKDTMINMQPWSVVEKFWYTCSAAWQKDDRTLDETKITEFFSRLKNAYGEYDESLGDMDSEYYSERSKTEMVDQSTMDAGEYSFAGGHINTNFGLCRRMDYDMQQVLEQKFEDGKRGLMPGQADHVFVPAMVLGISSKSSQTEAAEEFVKSLFSEEAQEVSTAGGLPVDGFPVEKDAFHSFIDGHEYEKITGSTTTIVEYVVTLEPTPEEAVAEMTELAESLTTPALKDQVIMDVVVEQGEKVLKGEISPEEGAAVIMKKANIYLAE